ncbi:MAG TPA: histidine kinase [Microlunatus sp.]|nr:histidine kinase [Microlunatus sp.]
MTALPPAQHLQRPTPAGARSIARSVQEDPGRSPWTATWLVAAVAVVIPEVALALVEGAPETGAAWMARCVPVAVGLAVVLTRVRVELAASILIVAMVTVFRSADVVLNSPGVWPTVAAIALFAGVCWVTCSLGLMLPLRWSAAWMAGLAVATVWALSFDVPVTMLGVGWWLVGVTFRHHEQISARLRHRADELAAEQERFATEAVRLERARIARELHDVVAHCMTVIVIQARAGQQLTDADPGGAAEALDAILATAHEAEQDLDTLVGVMDPHRASPLTREVLGVVVRRATAGGNRVDLTIHGDPDVLDPERAAVAHRVVQESLTNALRHAPGADVALTLDCRRAVTLTVENGPAAAEAAAGVGSGQGLLGIAERAAAVGGTARWGPTASGGWRLVVVLP